MMAQDQIQTTTTAETAGFLARLGAYLIDLVILGVINAVIYLLVDSQVLYNLVTFVVNAAYLVGFWTAEGATPGKMALGLRVVNAETGELISPAYGLLRYVGYIISGIALGLGFFWIIWDDKNQGWHDKIAKTVVIKIR